MPRDIIRVTIEDLSQFAKTLRSDLPNPPSHVEKLSLIARAAGYRNFQHLREKNTPLPQANDKQVRRALRYFDETGVMVEWPIRRRGESDGSNYQRLHKRPPAEAQVLIQRIAARQKEHS